MLKKKRKENVPTTIVVCVSRRHWWIAICASSSIPFFLYSWICFPFLKRIRLLSGKMYKRVVMHVILGGGGETKWSGIHFRKLYQKVKCVLSVKKHCKSLIIEFWTRNRSTGKFRDYLCIFLFILISRLLSKISYLLIWLGS